MKASAQFNTWLLPQLPSIAGVPVTLHDSFLNDIAEHPEDDTPRLIYASWLDEHEQSERAEFIRVQIALTQLKKDDTRRGVLKKRERSLIRRHKSVWLGVLPVGVQFLHFRRGFAEVKVHARAGNYLRKARRWHTETPLPHLFHLQLAGAQEYLPAVFATPLMSQLVELSLYGSGVGDEGARLLAEAPALSRLSSLCLHSNRVGPAGAQALARTPSLSRLASLDLGYNRLGDEGVRALAGASSLGRLLDLNLFATGISSAGALALAGSERLTSLARLDVTFNEIGEPGRSALRKRFGDGVLVGLERQHENR